MGEIRWLGKSELWLFFTVLCDEILHVPHPEPADPHAEALAVCFGRKHAKRTQQVAEILETLKALGQL